MEDNVKEKSTKKSGATDEKLGMVVQWFETSEEATQDARKKSERDRDYYDNKHFTPEEIKKLNKRKQPPVTVPLVRRKVNFLLGHETQTRSDPKAYPRNAPHDEQASSAATDALRYVADNQNCPDKFSDVFENLCVEGMGGAEVLYNIQKGEVEIKYWPWDRLFYDPHSSRHDFSDATYKGGVIWKDVEEAKLRYPGKEKEIENTVNSALTASDSETFEDRPHFKAWVHGQKRKRVRIVQIYWKEGVNWFSAHFTKGGFLEGPNAVIFKDEDGLPTCPMILQSAYVDRENNRYGEVRELIDLQDEVNKRRSKALHLLNSRQTKGEAGAVSDVNRMKAELAKPDGHVEYNPNKEFDIIPTNDMAAGNLELLREAKDEMQLAGPNAALMGKQEGSASGRAILASQQGGITELSRLMGRYRHFKLRIYRSIWNRIRQFWREEKWIRVTDDERNIKFVGLNRQTTKLELLQEAVNNGEIVLEEAQQYLSDPAINSPIVQNNVAEMDMDIIIDEGPDTITIQQEQFETLTKLAAIPNAGVALEAEDFIQLSTLRNKDKVLERIEERKKQASQNPAAELEMASRAIDLKKTEAETEKIGTESLKNQMDAQKTAFELGQMSAQFTL